MKWEYLITVEKGEPGLSEVWSIDRNLLLAGELAGEVFRIRTFRLAIIRWSDNKVETGPPNNEAVRRKKISPEIQRNSDNFPAVHRN